MTAKSIYVDPSALGHLYFPHERSYEMARWRRRHPDPLPVTHHGRTEVVNAIALAVFRTDLNAHEATDAWHDLESDFVNGHLVQADILWRAALNRASELSRMHSPKLGTRTLDVLHVACALELGLRTFLTFDERQRALAVKAGLKIAVV